ncbi:transglutaminase domain-containing protein [Pseudoscardovia radai]|uniref:transglutaminase domain-containing protein n=1 Tax=Pseudoscardovia radai TaxID=987066 RepID=UPI003994F3E4
MPPPAAHAETAGTPDASSTVDVYRLFNPNTSEHLYTKSVAERDSLLLSGWTYESIAWSAPAASTVNVYRLCNVTSSQHVYTTSDDEVASLTSNGWRNEGVAFQSSDDADDEIPVYRQYDPNNGQHNYTTDLDEAQSLIRSGWNDEHIAWYAVEDPDPTITHPVTIYDRTDYSAIYDFNYYIDRYPDIKQAYGNDDAGALKHFATTGILENRQGKQNYDTATYNSMRKVASIPYSSDLYRMYNTNTGEHFYTSSVQERDSLLLSGWTYESIAWTSPTGPLAGDSIYRLYSPGSGRHFYTTDGDERDSLVKLGWRYEGVSFSSDPQQAKPVYRQYNQRNGEHNYTTSANEARTLIDSGWNDEGIAWYGMEDPDPTITHPVTIYDRTDYSAIYDFNYYIDRYPDIKQAYGNDDAGALKHFATTGILENRQGKQNYDTATYNRLKLQRMYPDAWKVLPSIGTDLRSAYNYSIRKWVKMEIAPEKGTHYYAMMGYTGRSGNCYLMAGTFTELAKALGYDAKQVTGYVLLKNGYHSQHSWVEIDGRVYDPDCESELKVDSFGKHYGDPGTLKYHKEGYMKA